MGAKLSAKEREMREEALSIPAASRKHLPMEEVIALRRADRMKFVDSLPAEFREIIHDYGLTVFRAIFGTKAFASRARSAISSRRS